jgi:predicted ATPase
MPQAGRPGARTAVPAGVLADGRSRPGGLVFILGEAGLGKTRLVEELAGRLRWQGARVAWGRCSEFERLLPYQPISEALRTLCPA